MSKQQPPSVTATFYVQLEPEWSSWQKDAEGHPVLEGAKAVRITQSRPTSPKAGTVLVKLGVQAPAGSFLPLRPEALVVIPESFALTTPILVEAHDPGVAA